MANEPKRYKHGIVASPIDGGPNPACAEPTSNIEGHIYTYQDKIKAYVEAAVRVVVTEDQTQTLTNKTLCAPIINCAVYTGCHIFEDDELKIVDTCDNTKAIQFDVGGTTCITGTLATEFTTAKTITLPDATDTLVGKATTDTLTNKTIDGDDNTISDISITSLKTDACSACVFISRNTCGVIVDTIGAPTSDVVGLTDCQTLTNKTIVVACNTITTAACGNLTSTELNAALAELQTDIDTRFNASSDVNHDCTTGFVADEHIDHASVCITAGNGLTGGGDISTSRTINVAGTANEICVSACAVGLADNPILPGTGAMTVPKGTTAQQPCCGVNGMFRYNDCDSTFEGYSSCAWGPIAGGGGASPTIRNYQDFETCSASDYFTASCNLTLACETVAPLEGCTSAKFTQTCATACDFITSSVIDVSDPEFHADYIGLEFLTNVCAIDNAYRLDIESTCCSCYTVLDSFCIKNGLKENLSRVLLGDCDTCLRFKIYTQTPDNCYSFIIDKIRINLDPDLTVKSTESGAARLHTASGYGSTDNKIVRYSKVAVNGDKNFICISCSQCIANGFFEILDSAANGTRFVAKKDANVVFSVTGNFTGGNAGFGLSLDSTELTTTILSICVADRLTGTNDRSGSATSSTTMYPLSIKTGQIIRVHTDGSAVANAARHSIGITATKIEAGKVFKSQTSDLDTNSYTPTFQGFGCVTCVDFTWRQSGDSLVIAGRFTAGTPTATEAQIGLPSGYTVKTESGSNTKLVGVYIMHSSTASNGGAILATNEDAYFNFSDVGLFNSSTLNPSSPANGSNVAFSCTAVSFTATVPVNELSASDIMYFAPVGDQVENTYSARIDGTNTGTFQPDSQSSPFIQSITRNSTGNYSVTWVSGFFTEAPTLFIEPDSDPIGNVRQGSFDSVTTSGVNLGTNEFAGCAVDLSFNIIVQRQGTDYNEPKALIANAARHQTAYLKDVKPSGTDGGTFTSGAWQTRNLNTVSGSSSFVTLSCCQFTLAPGTYEISWSAPAHSDDGNGVVQHQSALYNITDCSFCIIGSSEDVNGVSGAEITTQSLGMDQITISTNKTFELQHRSGATQSTNGFGRAANFSVGEVYSQMKITKIR